MNLMQIGCIFILAAVAVITTLSIFHLDKHYNTPLLNSVYMQAFGIVMLLVIGIFMFREQYKWNHFVGILVILLGIYITNL
jgi:drug/metabolite transporter (DMT)-like permease